KINYLCNPSNNLIILVVKLGSVAQLVQSISFTPRGSAVRIRALPQKKTLLNIIFMECISAVSEHLVYTERVPGSNPCTSTKKKSAYYLNQKVYLCWFRTSSLHSE